MLQYNGVYIATDASRSISADEAVLIELQVPANVQMELIRFWIGPSEGADPVAEIQEVCLYLNDGPATGGTALTEQEVKGSLHAAASVAAIAAPTIAATPVDYIFDAYHVQNGWVYLPLPEERIRVAGGTTNDNIGVRFPVAPDAAMTISCGATWGELG